MVAILSQFKFSLDRQSLERIYISNIRPIMEYADVVWAGSNHADLTRLDSIQKDAARVVTGATARCNTELLGRDVGWQSLAERRRHHRLVLFYKTVNGLSPPYLSDLLPRRTRERTRYVLRTAEEFTRPFCRLLSFSRSFIPDTAEAWNKLDWVVKNVPRLSLFQSKLTGNTVRPRKNPLFYAGARFDNVNMARLRIRCSCLNSYLYNYVWIVLHVVVVMMRKT